MSSSAVDAETLDGRKTSCARGPPAPSPGNVSGLAPAQDERTLDHVLKLAHIAPANRRPGAISCDSPGSYAVAPVMAGWTSAGGSVAGGPDVGLAGPSVHLLIGFGGMGPAK